MTKEELALEVIERLKKEYPDAGCTLDYDEAWKLLVSVRLAAQCTDARVNVVVEDLYAKYPDVDALAGAEVEEIERIVRPCGLGKSKGYQCLHEASERGIRRKDTERFRCALKTSRCREKKCKSYYGGCFRKTGNCDGHALHPTDESDWSGGRHQGAEKSRNGFMENYPA